MFFFILIGIIFFLEYYVKDHMDKIRTLQEQRSLAGGKLLLKKYYNTGMAGNFLKARPKAACMLHISALLAVAAALLWILPKKHTAVAKTGLSFLAGGGLSNLYDRLTKGHVVDYVSFGFGPKRFRRLVFNLADFFVFSGIFLCIIQVFRKESL